MDISDLLGERETFLNALDKAVKAKGDSGRALAHAEFSYKKANTKCMMKMMLVGYETLEGKTKPIAATACATLAQGDDLVAELRLQRDVCAATDSVNQEEIYRLKLQINIIGTDLENCRRGR